jgi:hypothetical protein
MMSKKQTTLFFAGEVMDVDGITGGFKFQHAWTSGLYCCETYCFAKPQLNGDGEWLMVNSQWSVHSQ